MDFARMDNRQLDQMVESIRSWRQEQLIDDEAAFVLLSLIDKFRAGDYHHRCAACYHWITVGALGKVAIYEPESDGQKIGFVTCVQCSQRMESDWERISKNVRSYLEPRKLP